MDQSGALAAGGQIRITYTPASSGVSGTAASTQAPNGSAASGFIKVIRHIGFDPAEATHERRIRCRQIFGIGRINSGIQHIQRRWRGITVRRECGHASTKRQCGIGPNCHIWLFRICAGCKHERSCWRRRCHRHGCIKPGG
jgi:hypothetical protein